MPNLLTCKRCNHQFLDYAENHRGSRCETKLCGPCSDKAEFFWNAIIDQFPPSETPRIVSDIDADLRAYADECRELGRYDEIGVHRDTM